CDDLAAKGLFIRPAGIQPAANGAESPHYEFRHALYRQATYARLSNSSRSMLHKTLGENLRNFQHDNLDSASEIALHFEQAREDEEAVKYLVLTAEHAVRRFAQSDAIQVLRHARDLVLRIGGSHRATLEIAVLRRIGDASYALGAMSESVA